MELPITERRKQITRLFLSKDWANLEKLGISATDKTTYAADCGYYVLEHFGLPTTQEGISFLRNLPKLDDGNIVFYGSKGRVHFQIKHFGFRNGGKVESKWENGPVMIHNIEDVPHTYGDLLFFGRLTPHDITRETAKAHELQRTTTGAHSRF